MTPARAVGQRIRALRMAKGLSQAEIARRTGMCRPNVARLEAGKRAPHLNNIARIAVALGVVPSLILSVMDEAEVDMEAMGESEIAPRPSRTKRERRPHLWRDGQCAKCAMREDWAGASDPCLARSS